MKIAVFHNTPTGGARRVIYEHCRMLKEEGHEVHLFQIGDKREKFLEIRKAVTETTYYRYDGLEDLRFRLPLLSGHIENVFRIINYFKVWRICRRIAADIDGGNFDAAYIHHCAETQTPPILRYLKTPSVFFCQEPYRLAYEPTKAFQIARRTRKERLRDLYYSPLEMLYRRMKKVHTAESVASATVVLANSCYSQETVYRCYGIRARLCYLGVDGEKFVPIEGEKENSVVTIGRLQSFKGHDFLIESLGLLPAKDRPKLVIIADAEVGNEREYLNKLAERRGVRLEVKKLVAEDEMAKTICRSKIFVYAAVMEPFGLAALEGMACGLPVVGVREAGIRETVEDGVTGLLTERDPEEFAQALGKLLAQAELAREMGKNARTSMETNWTWEKSVRKLTREFEKAMLLGGAFEGDRSREPGVGR